MSKIRLTTTLVAIALLAAGCGSARPSANPGHPGSPVYDPAGSVTTRFAVRLLNAVQTPERASEATHSPTKALDHLPESPSLKKPPTVVKRFWTVDMPAADAFAWLRQHRPQIPLDDSGVSYSSESPVRYLGFRATQLPASIGAGYLYLTVAPTGPGTSAIGAYGVTAVQQPRPAAEVVPLNPDRVVIGWALAVGGTPVRKELTGAAATKLAREFNALSVDPAGMVVCPMIPTRYADITVTFYAGGHRWRADIPGCPDIHVTRDGATLPALAFGDPFLATVKSYTGYLPHAGPPSAPGGAIPLNQTPSAR